MRTSAIAVADSALLTVRAHVLDVLDLHHGILATYRRLSAERRYSDQGRALAVSLSDTIRVLLLADRRTGFAAARTWLAWGDQDIQQIVLNSVAEQPLSSYEETAFLRQSYAN